MDTVLVAILMVMVGILILLGLIGLAIGLGYVNVTTAWIVQDPAPETAERIQHVGERTRRLMDAETRRYLDELYENDLAAIEAEYQTPADDAPESIVNLQDFRSYRSKGRTL
jgi:hypothetical protein